MEDLELYKSFVFEKYSFSSKHSANRTKGIPRHYIGYLSQGYGRLVSDECTLELEEGDLFYIPKGCRYHSYWYGKDGTEFDSFGFGAIPGSPRDSQESFPTPQFKSINSLLFSFFIV